MTNETIGGLKRLGDQIGGDDRWDVNITGGDIANVTITDATIVNPIVTGIDALVFDPVAGASYAQGKLVYDQDNQCLTFFNDDPNVAMQIGQEIWVRVVNNTGSPIPNGTPVYVNGATSGWPTVALAQANALATLICIGLTTETIANGASGYVTSLGVVRGINTSGFAAGATVFLSAASPGTLTTTAPTAPNYRFRVGVVTVSDAVNGSIHVTPTTGVLGAGTANQVLGMNNAGTAQEYKTLSVGTTGTDFNIALGTANSIVVNLPSASATNRGAITTGAQTIAGVKTFSSSIVAPSIGPNSGQVHALPAVASDTVALLNATQTFANKTLTSPIINVRDNVFTLQDDGDPTKQARFQLSGITAATTRTYTLPNADDDLVGRTIAQTLTNKTLTAANVTATPANGDSSTLVASTAFVNASNGCSRVLLASSTASASSSLNFTTIGSYDVYELEFNAVVPATNAVAIYIRISSDGGSTWKNTGYAYGTGGSTSAAVTVVNGTATDTGFTLNGGANMSNTAGIGFNGNAKIYNLPSSTLRKVFTSTGQFYDGTNYRTVISGANYTTDTNAINAIQVIMSSGNIASGKVTLYGIRTA